MKYGEAKLFKLFVAHIIFYSLLLFLMVFPVNFYDYVAVKANEINNVVTHDVLSSEMQPRFTNAYVLP